MPFGFLNEFSNGFEVRVSPLKRENIKGVNSLVMGVKTHHYRNYN